MAKEPGTGQKVMSRAGRVLLTGVLMFGFVLALVYAYRLGTPWFP